MLNQLYKKVNGVIFFPADVNKYVIGKGVLIFSFLLLTVLASSNADTLFSIFQVSTAQTRAASNIASTNVTVSDDGTIILYGSSANVTQVMISRASDFAGASWQPFDAEKFKAMDKSPETLYVKFKTGQGVVSNAVVYSPNLQTLNEGDIVKTPDNPDVYIIKYKEGKQYIRLILSPSVFNSYGHLKWSNLKTVPREQMNKYSVSNLVQVANDKDVYLLIPNGDEGERRILDTNQPYDSDSIYEINSVDRDSYQSTTSANCSGSATQTCTITNGTGSQSRTCNSGTWSAWGNCALVSCSGGYQVSGNVCSPITDTVKPVVTSFMIPTTSSSLTVPISSFTATDNVAVTGYALTESSTVPSSAAFVSAKPTAYTFAASGSKTLYAWAKDAAGNISVSLSDSVTISTAPTGGGGGGGSTSDSTAPTVTAFTIPTTATSLTVSISTFTATDAVGVTGYKLTESLSAPAASAVGWTGSAPATYVFSSQGAKTLYAWAKDAAGNVSTSLNDSVTITVSDSTAPTVTAFVIPATATSLTVSVSSFTANDAVGVTGYLLNETSSAPAADAVGWVASAPANYTFATAGSKTLYAWAKDAAGNVSTSLNDSVAIDTIAPTVTAFVIPATATSLTVSISTFTTTDAVGVTGYLLTETSAAPAAGAAGWVGSAPVTYVFATQGSKTLYAWAKDAAGNVSTSLNDAVTITLPDSTAPTVTSFTVPSTATSLTVSISTFTATDAVGVTGYKLTESSSAPAAGAAGWTASAPTTYVFSSQGAKTLYAWAKDAAGNVSTALNDSVTITIDSSYVTGAMSTSAQTIFLHHSTGAGVWGGGVPGAISTYNTNNDTSYGITEDWYQQNTGNYPYDYWNIWINHAGNVAFNGDDTLEILTQTYDVIAFKHCFPVSYIGADTGSPNIASSNQTLENYYLQYAALKEKMHQFPNKRFIIWTGAALTQAASSEADATRARTFFAWVKNTWDEPGDNIFVWDFFNLETSHDPNVDGLYLLPDHASGDSHPNGTFNTEVAPLFADRIIDVIEGRGDD